MKGDAHERLYLIVQIAGRAPVLIVEAKYNILHPSPRGSPGSS